MKGIGKSNKISIQQLEQKQEEITIELRNLLKTNEALINNIKRIRKITLNSNCYPSRQEP